MKASAKLFYLLVFIHFELYKKKGKLFCNKQIIRDEIKKAKLILIFLFIFMQLQRAI